MRVLVVGLGSIGRRHVENLLALRPDSELVTYSHHSGLGSQFDGSRHRVVDSLADALTSKPDLAIVASATHLHAPVLLGLVAANIPTYIEKPILAERVELDAVRAAISRKEYTAASMVGCNLRFLPSLRAAREICRSGEIGRIVRAHLEAGQWLPDWRPGRPYLEGYSAFSERGGGVVLDLIHELDAVRWFLGEFDEVRSILATRSSLGLNSEDVAGILLSRECGPLVTIGLDYVARVPIRRYEFVGEEGTLTWDLGTRSVSIDQPGQERRHIDSAEGFDIVATYRAAMQEMIGAVESGSTTSQPLEEGLRSMDLALTVKEASNR